MSEEQERIPRYGILDKIDHEVFMAIQNRDVMDCVSDATDRVIELVREAMLSELRRDGDDDTFLHSMRWEFAACSVVDAPDADEFAHDTVKHVEKAITVAFGPASDGEQHEEGEGAMSRDYSLVIHVSEMSRFPDAVYIGRAMPRRKLKASPFANPFKIGTKPPAWFKDADLLADPMSREGVLFGYANWFLSDPDRIEMLPALRGKHLACWCRKSDEQFCSHGKGDNRCHGDCITHWLSVWSDDDLQRMADDLRPDAGTTAPEQEGASE